MNVLVTGGAGFIGAHASKALLHAGHSPVVFDNFSTGHRSAVRYGPLVEGDLLDADCIRRALREHAIRVVLHFAASAYVGESVLEPRKYLENNAAGSLSLLGAMLDENIEALVFSSTCATYGAPEKMPITESFEQTPINPYGESKLFVERALRSYARAYGVRWVAVRYFNVIGADPDGGLGEVHEPETHLVPLALETAAGLRGPLQVCGSDYPTPDGTAIRDYVDVNDIADAHVRALSYLVRGGASDAFNVGTGQGHSVLAILDAVESVTGRTVPRALSSRREGNPSMLVASAEKALRVLDWRPQRTLHESISTAWRFLCRRCGVPW